MGYKLCTAEKPSVAADIARVVGAKKREHGYYIGNGYIVTWAVGHLVGLAEPEEYGFVSQEDMYGDDEAKKRAYAELPLLPQEFRLVVLEDARDQFEIVKLLMHRPDVDEIIDCGDMGAEGHILQWFIREMAGNTKPVKRFCATSMTDEAIEHAMNHLRDAEEFMPVIRGEFCKKKEDWILGMSLSRALSIKYRAGINVGRVQSPTLGFVVKRYLEVQNFKVTNYYTMDATVGEDRGFHVFWNEDTTGAFPSVIKTSQGRVLNKPAVDAKSEEIKAGGRGVVTELVTARKATDRPQLYDILELQRDANRKYGYSAALTLATMQALYETQKVLTYPRTDSRYITSDLEPYMEGRVKMIATIGKYEEAAKAVLSKGLNLDKKIVNDSEVTDHHAIIPTEKIKGFDPAGMKPTDKEKGSGVTSETLNNILDLVLTRVLVAFSPAFKYEQTDVEVTFGNGLKFTARGKKPVDMGWKAIQEALSGKEEKDEDSGEDAEQIFPNIQKGQTVVVRDCQTVAKKTTPPKLYTEDTLLSAMKNAGQQIENGAILKGRGIGTQATRAEIIEKLFKTGVVETELKGKTPYIKPTKKGMNVIRVLPPDLYSPKVTADWETKIAELVEGKGTEEGIMREFETYIKAKTEQIKSMNLDVSFGKEREIFGACPWCGNPVYRFQEKNEKGKATATRYYCSENCGWGLKPDDMTFVLRTGRKITEAEAKRLIAKKFITLECTSKAGSKYRGEFTFDKQVRGDKVFCNIKCEPVKVKLKKR